MGGSSSLAVHETEQTTVYPKHPKKRDTYANPKDLFKTQRRLDKAKQPFLFESMIQDLLTQLTEDVDFQITSKSISMISKSLISYITNCMDSLSQIKGEYKSIYSYSNKIKTFYSRFRRDRKDYVDGHEEAIDKYKPIDESKFEALKNDPKTAYSKIVSWINSNKAFKALVLLTLLEDVPNDKYKLGIEINNEETHYALPKKAHKLYSYTQHEEFAYIITDKTIHIFKVKGNNFKRNLDFETTPNTMAIRVEDCYYVFFPESDSIKICEKQGELIDEKKITSLIKTTNILAIDYYNKELYIAEKKDDTHILFTVFDGEFVMQRTFEIEVPEYTKIQVELPIYYVCTKQQTYKYDMDKGRIGELNVIVGDDSVLVNEKHKYLNLLFSTLNLSEFKYETIKDYFKQNLRNIYEHVLAELVKERRNLFVVEKIKTIISYSGKTMDEIVLIQFLSLNLLGTKSLEPNMHKLVWEFIEKKKDAPLEERQQIAKMISVNFALLTTVSQEEFKTISYFKEPQLVEYFATTPAVFLVPEFYPYIKPDLYKLFVSVYYYDKTFIDRGFDERPFIDYALTTSHNLLPMVTEILYNWQRPIIQSHLHDYMDKFQPFLTDKTKTIFTLTKYEQLEREFVFPENKEGENVANILKHTQLLQEAKKPDIGLKRLQSTFVGKSKPSSFQRHTSVTFLDKEETSTSFIEALAYPTPPEKSISLVFYQFLKKNVPFKIRIRLPESYEKLERKCLALLLKYSGLADAALAFSLYIESGRGKNIPPNIITAFKSLFRLRKHIGFIYQKDKENCVKVEEEISKKVDFLFPLSEKKGANIKKHTEDILDFLLLDCPIDEIQTLVNELQDNSKVYAKFINALTTKIQENGQDLLILAFDRIKEATKQYPIHSLNKALANLCSSVAKMELNPVMTAILGLIAMSLDSEQLFEQILNQNKIVAACMAIIYSLKAKKPLFYDFFIENKFYPALAILQTFSDTPFDIPLHPLTQENSYLARVQYMKFGDQPNFKETCLHVLEDIGNSILQSKKCWIMIDFFRSISRQFSCSYPAIVELINEVSDETQLLGVFTVFGLGILNKDTTNFQYQFHREDYRKAHKGTNFVKFMTDVFSRRHITSPYTSLIPPDPCFEFDLEFFTRNNKYLFINAKTIKDSIMQASYWVFLSIVLQNRENCNKFIKSVDMQTLIQFAALRVKEGSLKKALYYYEEGIYLRPRATNGTGYATITDKNSGRKYFVSQPIHEDKLYTFNSRECKEFYFFVFDGLAYDLCPTGVSLKKNSLKYIFNGRCVKRETCKFVSFQFNISPEGLVFYHNKNETKFPLLASSLQMCAFSYDEPMEMKEEPGHHEEPIKFSNFSRDSYTHRTKTLTQAWSHLDREEKVLSLIEQFRDASTPAYSKRFDEFLFDMGFQLSVLIARNLYVLIEHIQHTQMPGMLAYLLATLIPFRSEKPASPTYFFNKCTRNLTTHNYISPTQCTLNYHRAIGLVKQSNIQETLDFYKPKLRQISFEELYESLPPQNKLDQINYEYEISLRKDFVIKVYHPDQSKVIPHLKIDSYTRLRVKTEQYGKQVGLLVIDKLSPTFNTFSAINAIYRILRQFNYHDPSLIQAICSTLTPDNLPLTTIIIDALFGLGMDYLEKYLYEPFFIEFIQKIIVYQIKIKEPNGDVKITASDQELIAFLFEYQKNLVIPRKGFTDFIMKNTMALGDNFAVFNVIGDLFLFEEPPYPFAAIVYLYLAAKTFEKREFTLSMERNKMKIPNVCRASVVFETNTTKDTTMEIEFSPSRGSDIVCHNINDTLNVPLKCYYECKWVKDESVLDEIKIIATPTLFTFKDDEIKALISKNEAEILRVIDYLNKGVGEKPEIVDKMMELKKDSLLAFLSNNLENLPRSKVFDKISKACESLPTIEKVKCINILVNSEGRRQPSFKLNRFSSASFFETKGDKGKSLLTQIIEQTEDNDMLKGMTAEDVPFHIDLLGEGAIDGGGPGREVFSQVCIEIMHPLNDLFILTPTDINETMTLIPNPKNTNSLAFKCAGALLGACLYHHIAIPFKFSKFIWKYLISGKLTIEDVYEFDPNLESYVKSIENATDMTPEEFQTMFSLTFQTASILGQQVPLIAQGSSMPVTLDQIDKFLALLKDFKVHEFDVQLQALREGFVLALNEAVVLFFTPEELEKYICGDDEVTVQRIKDCCNYNQTDEGIDLLWEALERMTNEERRLFVMFSCGLSGLPPEGCTMKERIEISMYDLKGNTLPIAHTCSFKVEIPKYETLEDMLKGLRIAIEYGIGHIEDNNMNLDEADF